MNSICPLYYCGHVSQAHDRTLRLPTQDTTDEWKDLDDLLADTLDGLPGDEKYIADIDGKTRDGGVSTANIEQLVKKVGNLDEAAASVLAPAAGKWDGGAMVPEEGGLEAEALEAFLREGEHYRDASRGRVSDRHAEEKNAEMGDEEQRLMELVRVQHLSHSCRTMSYVLQYSCCACRMYYIMLKHILTASINVAISLGSSWFIHAMLLPDTPSYLLTLTFVLALRIGSPQMTDQVRLEGHGIITPSLTSMEGKMDEMILPIAPTAPPIPRPYRQGGKGVFNQGHTLGEMRNSSVAAGMIAQQAMDEARLGIGDGNESQIWRTSGTSKGDERVGGVPRGKPEDDGITRGLEDMWCSICSDDAILRCRQCEAESGGSDDGAELFCARCFKEVHGGDLEMEIHRPENVSRLGGDEVKTKGSQRRVWRKWRR